MASPCDRADDGRPAGAIGKFKDLQAIIIALYVRGTVYPLLGDHQNVMAKEICVDALKGICSFQSKQVREEETEKYAKRSLPPSYSHPSTLKAH